MPRKEPKTIPHDERKKILDNLWTTIALLESKDEVKAFFKDLLSETEAIMLARRIQIARMLLENSSYDEISRELEVSCSTIANVHRWLQSGSGGYESSLPKLEKELERKHKKDQKNTNAQIPYTAEWMKSKYPLYFLLLNLTDDILLRTPKKLRPRSIPRKSR